MGLAGPRDVAARKGSASIAPDTHSSRPTPAPRNTRAAARSPATPVTVEGVRISSPGKVLWPDEGITKLELVRYHAALAPVILRYVRHRPLTLRPFPRGVDKPGFYIKDAPKGAPEWLQTFCDVAQSTGEAVHFVVAEDARTLVWLAQFNSVEVHAWLSTVECPDQPDWAVVDLDPPDEMPAGLRQRNVVTAAVAMRDELARRGLKSFPKVSGQTGVHVLVPLDPVHRFDDVRAFFEQLGEDLCQALPDLLTTDYDIAGRGGRILVDYAQNSRAKTTVAPYSVRPKPGAPVALPVTWDELKDPSFNREQWTLRTVPERVAKVGDLLEPALRVKQRLPAAR
ncbi:MAG: ATP-dependent DNA ligase clustered with Ku protein, LigD [uncultured Chloroflexi bacterium]|uniref:ATP-dependent DNA ligase clustered with Ku protein, LigD n=1 Tax=uncultured Chloroflexota bacterium TaxID=166587 RepID=A0A6J4JJU6_9CHLR|nr:MAG: ATP-dependent DNA ligase clustered with Ku protein, LigD [uncultured Chloroflexota bacterium]